jgi:hypothetical protein
MLLLVLLGLQQALLLLGLASTSLQTLCSA